MADAARGAGSDAAGRAGRDAAGSSGGNAALGGGGAGGPQVPHTPCPLEVPKRQCQEACTALRVLEGATRSPVQCDGDSDRACVLDLRIGPTRVLDAEGCDNVNVQLQLRNGGPQLRDGDETERVHYAMLTTAAWDEILQIAREFDIKAARAQLAPYSDCTDCGGRITSSLRASGSVFSYPYGEPPSRLSAADAFLQRLIDQMLDCRGELLEGECSVTQRPFDQSTTSCEISYARDPSGSSSTFCKIAPEVDAPCREVLECLCTGASLRSDASMTVDECVVSWLTPRGAITFSDVCTQLPAEPSRSLAAALDMFARAQGGATVTTSAACDAIDAWY